MRIHNITIYNHEEGNNCLCLFISTTSGILVKDYSIRKVEPHYFKEGEVRVLTLKRCQILASCYIHMLLRTFFFFGFYLEKNLNILNSFTPSIHHLFMWGSKENIAMMESIIGPQYLEHQEVTILFGKKMSTHKFQVFLKIFFECERKVLLFLPNTCPLIRP